MVSHALHEFKATLKAPGVEIIKKQPPNTSRFIPVFQEEVVITPFLVLRIDLFTKGKAGIASALVPADRVFFEGVIGGQVKSAAEPPDRWLILFFGKEEANIGVRGGYIGVSRMNHQGDSQGLKSSSGKISAMGGRRCREGFSYDMGKVDAPLLNDRTTSQNARPAPADAAVVGPLILFEESLRLFGTKAFANTVLEI